MLQQINFKKVAQRIENGETILYPTDTIWGIGGDATNASVVEKIYKIKNRPGEKSMLLLANNLEMVQAYVEEIPKAVQSILIQAKKPTTIIYPKAKNLPDNLVAADGSIAIRIPKDELCQELITTFGKPIISTSANRSGESSPSNFLEIETMLKEQIDYIFPSMSEHDNVQPSRIIKVLDKGGFEVIRD